MDSVTKCLGIDIGGTSAKYGIVDRKGAITAKSGFLTGHDMTREMFQKNLREVCIYARDLGAKGVGISCLGFIDSRKGQILSGTENIPFLTGMNIQDMVQGVFPKELTCIHNDCDCAALGERWLGAAAGCDNFFCITLGTGIGGSLVLDGKLITGAHCRTGEIGYFRYRSPEDYLERHYSTQSILEMAKKRLGLETLDGYRFIELIKEGHCECRKIFDEWMEALAAELANIILLLDVEKVIVGGGISEEKDLIIATLKRKTAARLPQAIAEAVDIQPARFANDAAIIGAAAPLLGHV